MSKAIVIGGSRGIGKAIADSLKTIGLEVVTTSKKELDTSDIQSVKDFIQNQKETDILVLNTGGPPAKEFFFSNRRRLATLSQSAILRILYDFTKT